MRLLVLGATGPTGRHLVAQALRHGDTVTVLVRRPAALGPVGDRVRVVEGDATSPGDVERAMSGQDAVISALGRGRSLRAHGLFTRSADALQEAARRTGVTRLVWMSSFGVGDTFASAHVLLKAAYGTVMRDVFADKKASEATIRAGGMDWTLVYPTTLTNGPARGAYRVVEDRTRMRLAARISRADVAAFLHAAAHEPRWIHRDAVITG
ncbi:NAD(P)-dependent oxidoreductase [Streptomyces abyssomicinicus]|uniref:NAD(P)-dependent oxidoreductase n=1 Tax=Streptomyces abyssomicinicus TaxID=574929 RepID=UPI00124F7F3D|nr:NAD(P)H-binding protein [Streptomyces abyssomicinicus]